ncbi:hypothetical protein [Moraxella caprae]|nr:hypothetical protein [Moraxella caprae]
MPINHKLPVPCLVEAKDGNAIAFYRHFGFLSFGSVSDKLYYPLT